VAAVEEVAMADACFPAVLAGEGASVVGVVARYLPRAFLLHFELDVGRAFCGAFAHG